VPGRHSTFSLFRLAAAFVLTLVVLVCSAPRSSAQHGALSAPADLQRLVQTAATIVAMTGNFILNNQLTYRDNRLTGFRFVKGLLGFYAISSVGALTNVGVASWLYAYEPVWWLAGLAGALMGVVWNYSMSTLLVWRAK